MITFRRIPFSFCTRLRLSSMIIDIPKEVRKDLFFLPNFIFFYNTIYEKKISKAGRQPMKRIVLAITLYISCMVVDYLVHYLNNRKKSSSPTTTQNSESYVVSCPASVKYVYMTIFALEIILFGVFLFLK